MQNGLRIIFDKAFSRYVRSGFIFALDIFLSFLSALLIVFGAQYLMAVPMGGRFNLVFLVSTTILSGLMFWVFKSYRIIIRHSSLSDIFHYGVAVLSATVLEAIVLLAFGLWRPTTWVLLIAFAILSVFLLVFCRVIMVRAYEEMQRRFRVNRKALARVLIYGTNDKAIALETRLRNSKHYEVVGYLTDVSSENLLTTHNLPAYKFKSTEELDRIFSEQNVSGIIFARDTDIRAEAQRLIPYATDHKLRLLVAPTIDDFANVTAQSVRNINVEDLLGRDEIAISMDKIKERFSGKVVMVTGAAGSIGSELCRQLARIGVKKLILYDNAETPMHNLRLEFDDKFPNLNFVPVIGDVRQKPRLDYVFRTWHPEIVFHAAAYKHVPLMEDNPCEAVLVNLVGSRQVADMCIEYGTEMMVMISTDKAVNPTNIMGCTKRLAEIYVQSIDNPKTKFVTTRFGNVLGSNGSVIPRFREQIENGGPVTVTHPDITRFFMTIPEACRLVLEAATLSNGKDIFVFDMGEPVKIDNLARRMIQLAGLEPDKDIKIVYSGLRPGEKLYEEVLSDKENTTPTSHDRIRIAKVRQYSYEDACRFSSELEVLSREVRIPEMVQMMKEVVPEFISKNSKFEMYDKK